MLNLILGAAGIAAVWVMWALRGWLRYPPPKPPAGESGPAPVPARTHPPASPPAGDCSPQAAPSASPPPEASTKCFDFRAAGWDCGCLIIRDRLHGKQRNDLCERHKFAAHWNERLRQS